jgi:hypothetical protein
MSVIPRETQDLLIQWITPNLTAEKVQAGLEEKPYYNAYSWVSGNSVAKPTAEQEGQLNAVRRSYILNEGNRHHKTKVYLYENYVQSELQKLVGDNYTVSLRKFENSKQNSLVRFRWVVQVRPIQEQEQETS